MTKERGQQIVLELQRGEPIHGVLRTETGSSQTFHGWLELSGALERAREESEEPRSPIDQEGRR